MNNINYNIVEIFESMQGEGFNTGMPAIFIRFGKCNLRCHWCDTDYHKYNQKNITDILSIISQYKSKNIIITGGEPTIQKNLNILLTKLKKKNYFLAIETNGLYPVPQLIDYIATSPKRLYADKYEKFCLSYADEVRIVVDGNIINFCEYIEKKIRAKNYYLSPCEINNNPNFEDTIKQLGILNQRKSKLKWRLSIQTHKLAMIR